MNTIQCQNCGAENVGTVNFCKQCGSRLERAAVTDPPPPNTPSPLAPPRMGTVVAPSSNRLEHKHTTLRRIATLCRIISYLLVGWAVLGVLGGLFIMFSDLFGVFADSFEIGLTVIGANVIFGIVAYVFWQLIAESISVMLDIEENTRRTAVLLEQNGRQRMES